MVTPKRLIHKRAPRRGLTRPASGRAPWLILAGVFFVVYLSWRPSLDVMFTTSDAFFIMGLVQLAMTRSIPMRPFGALTPPLLGGFIMMMTGLLIGSLASPEPHRWLTVAMQYGFAWIVLAFALVGHPRAYTISVAKALLLGLVLMEIFAGIIYFTYSSSFEEAQQVLGHDFLSGNRRLGAFASDANWNGAVCVLSLPVAFYLASKRHIGPILAVISVSALLLGVVLSASFTAFVSAAMVTAICGLAGGIRLPKWAMAAAVAGVFAFASVGLPSVFQKRVGAAVAEGDISQAGTFEGRLALMKQTWDTIDDYVIVGAGVDQDRHVNKMGAPVHNMYLLIWVEGGLLALLGWLTVLGVFMAVAGTAYRADRIAGASAIGVVLAFIIFSTASPHMYARLWAAPVLIVLAIARNAITEAQSNPTLASGSQRRSRAPAPAPIGSRGR